jgi:hypothetical protein
MTRVAILGARGIGAVQARVLDALGAHVCAIAATSPASARATAAELAARLGHELEGFASVAECLERSHADAVVIASPAECHREHLAAVLARELPVLCEKPLYWPAHAPVDELVSFQAELAARPAARLLLNTVSAHLLEAVQAELEAPAGDLEVEFHSLGRATGEAIAVDLLPHALALLAVLQPLDAPCEELELDLGTHRCAARFRHAGRRVRLDLRADPAGVKHLAFAVGGQRFTRRQEGSGASYRVFLEDERGRRHELEDPFVTRGRRFIALCAGRGDWPAARAEACANHAALVALLHETPRRRRALAEELPCRA